MTDHDRLAQLHRVVLRATLEGMPASPDRDRMLAEVRCGAVDIDTGIAPRPCAPWSPARGLQPSSVAPKRTPTSRRSAPAKPVQRRVAPRIPAPLAPPPRPPRPPRRLFFWEATAPHPADQDRVDLLAFDVLSSPSDEAPATSSARAKPARRALRRRPARLAPLARRLSASGASISCWISSWREPGCRGRPCRAPITPANNCPAP